MVFQPLRGNVRIDVFALQIRNVLLAEVTAGVAGLTRCAGGVESADLLIHAGRLEILL